MASGEPRGESPMAGTTSRLARWQGRLRLNGVVRVVQAHALSLDLICRTAVYVTRTHGGVGGGSREASPYPDSSALRAVEPLGATGYHQILFN